MIAESWSGPFTLETLVDQVESELADAGLAFGHGTDDPRDEAAWLVLAALGHDPLHAVVDPQAAVTRADAETVRTLLAARIGERRPLAYLTGRAWFAGLEFISDERALVPRSPLAELIVQRFHPWLACERVQRILDIGTGGGCIAIACAHAFAEAHVDATDVSEAALSLARENVDLHALDARVSLYEADVFEGLPDRRYDLIVSNPPYVDSARMAGLPAEYRHEPEDALAAGADGLDVVARILAGAHRYLQADGLLVVEVGGAAEALEAACPHTPFLWPDFEQGGEGVFVLSARDLPVNVTA